MILYIEFKVNGAKRFSFYDDEVNQFVNFKGMNSFKDFRQFETVAGSDNACKFLQVMPENQKSELQPQKMTEINLDGYYAESLKKQLKQAENAEDYDECYRLQNELKKYKT